MVVRIGGDPIYLWRAADHEGEVLDLLIQRPRDQRAATKLMRKLLKRGAASRQLPSVSTALRRAMNRGCRGTIWRRLTWLEAADGNSSRRSVPPHTGCAASNLQAEKRQRHLQSTV